METEIKKKITAVRKKNGVITRVQFSDGTEHTRQEVESMISSGDLTGYTLGYSNTGQSYIRALPDQNENNNLSMLPRF